MLLQIFLRTQKGALLVSLQTEVGKGEEGRACLPYKASLHFLYTSPLQSFKRHAVEGTHYASYLYSCLALVVVDAWQALR